ncbi:Dipeptidyl-peptidase 5 [Andreprevotia sp. IGB-42]|uniref:Tol-Pal system beta propeller repeat protein TolB n=1 Tax=Andreprevotia sp. IGB-42 TaxID=2497473 RepID=UPI00135AE6F6|nr:Tol-Pal system beta propeller repeat protein TolB [Andreprevotia sp. IGB-42]KAF0812383.1 Dipeptidyl-peptidase 5 [Andreprevotia sp. IGB-42]
MNRLLHSLKYTRQLLAATAVLLGVMSAAHADMTIEVVGTGASQFPIAIAPFQNEQGQKQPVTPVVGDDLTRSGLFKVIGAGDLSPVPYTVEQINNGPLKSRGAQTVLVGTVVPDGDSFLVTATLVDVATKNVVVTFQRKATAGQMRRTAHQIADVIYQKLTGEPGAFNSRIAYVLKQGKRFELQVADADGYGAQAVLASNQPIMSPKWSPDGGRLAYVSFEDQKPIVYGQDLSSGKRWKIAAFKGSNSAPAWAPNGKQLAVTLTRDGGSQVFIVNADGSGSPRRLTTVGEINTEASFSPDGGSVLFTSDRGGSPQIYRQAVNGGGAERLTFQNGYNASGKLSPDGKTMTLITRTERGFQVAVMDMASRQIQALTDTGLDDAPSFASNGRMILYETDVGGRGALAAVSSDGRVKQRLRSTSGDVRQPAWGPLLK